MSAFDRCFEASLAHCSTEHEGHPIPFSSIPGPGAARVELLQVAPKSSRCWLAFSTGPRTRRPLPPPQSHVGGCHAIDAPAAFQPEGALAMVVWLLAASYGRCTVYTNIALEWALPPPQVKDWAAHAGDLGTVAPVCPVGTTVARGHLIRLRCCAARAAGGARSPCLPGATGRAAAMQHARGLRVAHRQCLRMNVERGARQQRRGSWTARERGARRVVVPRTDRAGARRTGVRGVRRTGAYHSLGFHVAAIPP